MYRKMMTPCSTVQTTTILIPKSDAITETTTYEFYFCSLTDKQLKYNLFKCTHDLVLSKAVSYKFIRTENRALFKPINISSLFKKIILNLQTI